MSHASISVIFAISFLVNSGLCAKTCYSCSTSNANKCGDPSGLTPEDEQFTCRATNADSNCIKYSYTLEDRTIIVRGCKSKSYTCQDVKDERKEYGECVICPTDLCNSSMSTQFSRTLFISLLIVPFVTHLCVL